MSDEKRNDDGIGTVTVIESMGKTHIKYDSSFADIALSTSPAQSLTAYRNEVIEECAKVILNDSMAITYQSIAGYRDALIESIRELKGERLTHNKWLVRLRWFEFVTCCHIIANFWVTHLDKICINH